MLRIDGRRNDQMRKVIITPDYLKYAEGSCLIEMGDTKVVCSASVEASVPPFLKNSGNGWVTAEYGMLARSCRSRISRGKDSGRTFEIQRLVGRSLRTITQMDKLGERTVWIDCDVIQGDGGTRTASITGSFVALVLALNKIKSQGIINVIPVKEFVAAVSVGIAGGEKMLDLAYEEDSSAHVDMNIVMTSANEFIEIQGTAERKTFSRKDMDEMLALAQAGITKLISIQKEILEGII